MVALTRGAAVEELLRRCLVLALETLFVFDMRKLE